MSEERREERREEAKTPEVTSRALVAAFGGKGIILMAAGEPSFTAQFCAGTVLNAHTTIALGVPPDGLSVWEGSLTVKTRLVDVVQEALDDDVRISNSGIFAVEVVFCGRFRRPAVSELLYVAHKTAWAAGAMVHPWEKLP